MIRFVHLTLSNPAKPELPAISLEAVVTEEDYAISIGQQIFQQLQLDQVGLREAEDIGKGKRLLSYVGPLRLTNKNIDIFTGAVVCGRGVTLGRRLLSEFGLAGVITEATSGKPVTRPVVPQVFTQPKPKPVENREPRILMVENAVDVATCKKIADYMRSEPHTRATLTDVTRPTANEVKSFTETSTRDTFNVNTQGIRPLLNTLLYDMFNKHIEPYFGMEIEWWEEPQLLYYGVGGLYKAHADADRWVNRPGGNSGWERYYDRDVSILIYLNDEFTGGGLEFPDFKRTIQPKPGLLVAFPSSADYKHGALPTESGERMVIVSWAAAVGTPRVRERPKPTVLKANFKPG